MNACQNLVVRGIGGKCHTGTIGLYSKSAEIRQLVVWIILLKHLQNVKAHKQSPEFPGFYPTKLMVV